MSNPTYYIAQVGDTELAFYGPSDEHALRVVRRWIRLFWRRHVEHTVARYPGSIAHAICAGWYDTRPEWTLYAHPVDNAGVILCQTRVVVEDVPIEGASAC
jgi:hypothetical protein